MVVKGSRGEFVFVLIAFVFDSSSLLEKKKDECLFPKTFFFNADISFFESVVKLSREGEVVSSLDAICFVERK